MVTDRKIILSNQRTSVDLTTKPFYVENINGFDGVDVQLVTSQGFDQDGVSMVNNYIEGRELKIEGAIYAETTWQMQYLRDKILNLFLPKQKLTINHYWTVKSFNKKNNPFIEIYVTFKLPHLRKVQTI